MKSCQPTFSVIPRTPNQPPSSVVNIHVRRLKSFYPIHLFSTHGDTKTFEDPASKILITKKEVTKTESTRERCRTAGLLNRASDGICGNTSCAAAYCCTKRACAQLL